MKIVLLSIVSILINLTCFSQYVYKLRIVDTRGLSLKNVEVKAVCNEWELVETTNSSGKAIFNLTEPGEYKFSYKGIENVATFTVREGARGSGSKTVCYDPEKIFVPEPKGDRTGIRFKTITVKKVKQLPSTAHVTIKIVNKRKAPIAKLKILIVSCKDKLKYSATTDDKGEVVMYLPIKQTYEIDIDGLEAYKVFKIGNYPKGRFREFVFYEQTDIKEKIKEDTIIQKGIAVRNGTSTHKLYELKLKDYSGNKLANEPVYLKSENSPTVYKGVTNESGFVRFLVKKGSSYIVNLKYEQGIDLLDANEMSGFSMSRVTRRYRGSRQIEEMQAELKRQAEENARGYVTKHRETPIRVADKPASYLTKTDKGFDIDFKKSGPIGTPTLIDGKLYSQEGFYSPNFYCLDAKSGDYLWGVELGESGISPIVSQNGVLLINTYSCTLYAIDAMTGKLLWSKWLAGTIYSTPSADNENVYVVYDNGGTNPKNPEDSYVISSFDLKTGKLNWINWLDREVISCPVVDGKEVHVASQSGKYFVFDTEKGTLLKSLNSIKAITSPTLTDKNIFITTENKGKEGLTVLDRETYNVVKQYSNEVNAVKIRELKEGAFGTMNFNGSRPIVYKNENVILLDSSSVSVFDTKSETLLWEKLVNVNPAQIPVISDDKLIVATLKGEIISFDIKTGEQTILEKINEPIDGQPVSNKGKLYIASGGVLSIIKTLYNNKFNQWNKDASHNLNWE